MGAVNTALLLHADDTADWVAVLEEGAVVEVHAEARRAGLRVGDIVLGQVTRVVAGLHAAFVDIGTAQAAFLPLDNLDGEAYEGRRLPVQVVRLPAGDKGARVTALPALPGRFAVYLPFGDGVRVSGRIGDDAVRARLRAVLEACAAGRSGGFVVRTAARDADGDALAGEALTLMRAWGGVKSAADGAAIGTSLHREPPLPTRFLRDRLDADTVRVVADAGALFAQTRDFVALAAPALAARVVAYVGATPMFKAEGVDAAVSGALSRRVTLPGGGALVFDYTEAMTVVDVDTAANIHGSNRAATVLATNVEAARAVAAQARLRNLGGIVVVDFIDMHDAMQRRAVAAALERALADDPARPQLGTVTRFGLAEFVRRHNGPPLHAAVAAL